MPIRKLGVEFGNQPFQKDGGKVAYQSPLLDPTESGSSIH